MALNEQRKLTLEELQADRDVLLAIRELRDYQATNPTYSSSNLVMLEATLTLAQQEERRLTNALAAARDTAVGASWALHNALLGAKAQVIAQYGPDSHAVQALGLKRKSERKRPTRRSGRPQA